MDTVMTYFSEAMLVLLSLPVYVALVGRVYPSIAARLRYTAEWKGARVLKKYIFPSGRAMLCRPSAVSGRYLRRYILASSDGKKILTLLAAHGVTSVRCAVTAYDAYDRVSGVIYLSESFDQSGISGEIALPCDTAYVSLCVLEANGKRVQGTSVAYIPLYSLIALVTLNVITTLAELMIVKYNVGRLLLPGRFGVWEGFGFALLVSLVIGAVLSLVVLRRTLSGGVRISIA